MVDFIPQERATPIRYPSTANLMIDSADRSSVYSSPWNFQIARNSSILNGFFTRIGTTEVVLEWCQDNIVTGFNDTIAFDISGIGANTYAGTQTITFSAGNYTAASLLDTLVERLNDLSGTTGCTWAIDATNPPSGAPWALDCDEGYYTVNNSTLAQQLDLNNQTSVLIAGTTTGLILGCIDIRAYRYIDFVSSQLTYNQDLKDSSTAPFVRDVLCRWYMAWDNPPELDKYGFPILMGYTNFVARRLFNPPKQIKWSNSQPIGNLAFEVYGDNGLLVETGESEWLMTLQVSEV